MFRPRLSQAGQDLLQAIRSRRQGLITVSSSDSHYDTLGIATGASKKDIKRAFLKVWLRHTISFEEVQEPSLRMLACMQRAKQLHPDAQQAQSAVGHAAFVQLLTAYQVSAKANRYPASCEVFQLV